MGDWLDELDEPEVEVVDGTSIEKRPKTDLEIYEEAMLEMEAEIYEGCMQIIKGVVGFADIDPAEPIVPQKWVERWGEEEAEKLFRVAKSAWMPGQHAPVAIKVAQSTLVGMMKARAASKQQHNTLNVQLVSMTVSPEYPVVEVDD